METTDIKKIRSELENHEIAQTTNLEIFSEIIDNAMHTFGEQAEWMKAFRQSKTDFERICFLLRAVQSSSEGFAQFNRLETREDIARFYGKSDRVSELNRICSLDEWNKNEVSRAIQHATSAVFYALSPEQKAVSYSRRCNILFNLGLVHEAIRDGEQSLTMIQRIQDTEILKLPFLQEELAHVHLCLGESYIIINKLAEARMHLGLAHKFYNYHPQFNLMEIIIRGIAKCEESSTENELKEAYHSEWQCHRSKLPILVKSSECGDNAEGPEFELPGRILTTPNGLLRLKNTGPLSGWTLEVTKNVSAGEVMILDKAYAMSLHSERLTYCYICYKRCHNLIPCNGCPHAGFCSEECAKVAVGADGSADGRRHIQPHLYDCQGVLACLHANVNEDLLHAAFKCISNTTPGSLLDYCCSTGHYEKSGKGHQAFVGAAKVRETPPPVFNPSDYSSIAWLYTCSDKLNGEKLWLFTLNALFLTYCLHLGGYPMMWFDEFNEMNEPLFFSTPSASSRPTRIPASWLAACLLFHIMLNDVNNFEFGELLFKSKKYSPHSQVSLGFCLFPTLSLINHSCEPSAAVCVTDKGTAFLFALRPIFAGEEVTISYGPSLLFMNKSDRTRRLEDYFYFTCSCEACANNWDSKSEVIKNESQQSERWFELYSNISQKWYPWLEKKCFEGEWTLENWKNAAQCVEVAHRLCVQPSLLLSHFKQLHKIFMHTLRGVYTIEPWAFSD